MQSTVTKVSFRFEYQLSMCTNNKMHQQKFYIIVGVIHKSMDKIGELGDVSILACFLNIYIIIKMYKSELM